MIDATRLQERLEASGLSQTALAKAVGVTQGTIAHLLSGRSQKSAHLHLIAKALRTSTAYLSGETTDPRFKEIAWPNESEMAAHLEMSPIQEIDLAYGLGGQYLDVQAVEETTVWFPTNFLRQYTNSGPEHLRFCRGDGDSMVPTIGNHDIVLFDMSQNHLNRQNAIWVVAVADIGMIKRVRAEPDGSYVLMSDNKLVDPQTVVDGEMHVIGRVVAVIRGM